MDDNSVPGFWPFIYDRIFVHWRSSLLGICGGIAVVVPILQAQAGNNKWTGLAGTLSLAITAALSKDN